MVDILLLGATGFTGRLVTRYLYNHPERSSFTFAIGVRSAAKGEALRTSLGLDESVKVVQVDVSQYDTVARAVEDAKVVINVVGPYWSFGENVVRACAVHGKRYVDLAGELHFVRDIIARYDYLASKTGAIIVPTCGFDCIPADILVFLSNRTLKTVLGPDAEPGLSQTFYGVEGGVSGGTIATLMSDIETVPRHTYTAGQRDYALSLVRGHPSPRPALAAHMPFSSPAQYGGYWFEGSTNRGIVQRTFGITHLLATNARVLLGSTHAKELEIKPLTYGSQFRYVEYMLVGKSWLGAAAFSVLFTLFLKLLFRNSLFRWILKLFLPKPGEGPSEKDMEKGWAEVTNFTASATSAKVFAKSTMHCKGDPGYLLTASMLSESALALLLDDASLPVTAHPGGVLTPATALGDALIRRLETTGRIHFESDIVREDGENRKDR
ncbi:Saccharopine dehydrogenase-domain-containing protein [Daedaleopsis nitida]|nr:Saccharopine dehydrogenase-domain-containing protein [Daedaleopsis nitida]